MRLGEDYSSLKHGVEAMKKLLADARTLDDLHEIKDEVDDLLDDLLDAVEGGDDEIEDLEKRVEELEEKEPIAESDDPEKALELFADPNNWLERVDDGKFIWSPVMNYVERDPSFLASQALKTI